MIYFLKPNLIYCSSDIVNFENLFKSKEVILLKSKSDWSEWITNSVKSEIYYLTLRARLNGAFNNF